MRSLRLAMIAHGIPHDDVADLAALLRIETLEDLEELHFTTFMQVPHAHRDGILALRNAYKHVEDYDWPAAVDGDWIAFDYHFWLGVVQQLNP